MSFARQKIRISPKLLLVAVPLVALSLWLATQALNALVPTQLLCGEVISHRDDALKVAMKAMLRWDNIREDLSSEVALSEYMNTFSNCCRAAVDKDNNREWNIDLTLPSKCGFLVDWVLNVRRCGGKIISGATIISDQNPIIQVLSEPRMAGPCKGEVR